MLLLSIHSLQIEFLTLQSQFQILLAQFTLRAVSALLIVREAPYTLVIELDIRADVHGDNHDNQACGRANQAQ